MVCRSLLFPLCKVPRLDHLESWCCIVLDSVCARKLLSKKITVLTRNISPQELRHRVYDFTIPRDGISYHVLSQEGAWGQMYPTKEARRGVTITRIRCPDGSSIAIHQTRRLRQYGLAVVNSFVSKEFLEHVYATALFTFYLRETPPWEKGVWNFDSWNVSRGVLNKITHCAFAVDFSCIESPRHLLDSHMQWRADLDDVRCVDYGYERPKSTYVCLDIAPGFLARELPRRKSMTTLLVWPRWKSDNEADWTEEATRKEPIYQEYRVPFEKFVQELDNPGAWWLIVN